MMGFTADGQVNRKLLEKRDADYGVTTTGKCAVCAAPPSRWCPGRCPL